MPSRSLRRCSCLLLVALFSVASGPARAAVPASGDADSWWEAALQAEVVASSFRRTAQELAAFNQTCHWLAPYLHGVQKAHSDLKRVIVIDARHNWRAASALKTKH